VQVVFVELTAVLEIVPFAKLCRVLWNVGEDICRKLGTKRLWLTETDIDDSDFHVAEHVAHARNFFKRFNTVGFTEEIQISDFSQRNIRLHSRSRRKSNHDEHPTSPSNDPRLHLRFPPVLLKKRERAPFIEGVPSLPIFSKF